MGKPLRRDPARQRRPSRRALASQSREDAAGPDKKPTRLRNDGGSKRDLGRKRPVSGIESSADRSGKHAAHPWTYPRRTSRILRYQSRAASRRPLARRGKIRSETFRQLRPAGRRARDAEHAQTRGAQDSKRNLAGSAVRRELEQDRSPRGRRRVERHGDEAERGAISRAPQIPEV